jgi:general secretion pathway protein M
VTPDCGSGVCRKALIIVGAFALLLVGLLATPVYYQHQRYDEELSKRQDRLQRFRQALAGIPRLEQEIQALRDAARTDEYYLEARTPALAGAALQSRIKAVVEANGAELVRIQTMNEEKEDWGLRVPVKVTMRADVEAMTQIFYELESAKPYLFLDQLTVRAMQIRRNPRQPQKNATERSNQVDFFVAGYLRKPA